MGLSVLQIAISVASGLAALWLVVLLVRDERMDNRLLNALVLIEAGLVAQLIWGAVRVLGDPGRVSVPTYLGYLVGALLILPAGVVWSSSERSRSGTAVLLVAVLLVPLLCLRLAHIWAAHG